MIRESMAAWLWSLVRLDFVGVMFAALFFCLSLTPSLLPRDWLTAGIIGGINAGIGYAIGVLFGSGVRRLFLRGRSWWPPPRRVRYGLQSAAIALSIGASVLTLLRASVWQGDIAAVMGIAGPATAQYLRALFVAVVTGLVLIATARVVKDAIKFTARVMIRRWNINDEVAMFTVYQNVA